MIYIAGNSCVTYNQPTMTSPGMQKGVSSMTISFTPRYSFSRRGEQIQQLFSELSFLVVQYIACLPACKSTVCFCFLFYECLAYILNKYLGLKEENSSLLEEIECCTLLDTGWPAVQILW